MPAANNIAQIGFLRPVFALKKTDGLCDKAATIKDNKNGNILNNKKRQIIIVIAPIIATYKKLIKKRFFA